ncbi:MAG: calcium-binding protein [Phormidesmis sp. RL_2_1]|nr:calcium-binding protein [Phormidesmis sp. RL_2_1]
MTINRIATVNDYDVALATEYQDTITYQDLSVQTKTLMPESHQTDIIVSSAGDDVAVDNDESRIYFGNLGFDSIEGFGGSDSISSSRDQDSVLGGDYDDFLFESFQNDTILGGNGNDSIYGSQNDTILGGNGNDSIYGSQNEDILFDNSVNDTVYGDLGSDSIAGESSNNRLEGENGSNILLGKQEHDFLSGGFPSDTLFCDDGSDYLEENGGDCLVTNTDGNVGDTLIGGCGDGTLVGGNWTYEAHEVEKLTVSNEFMS